MFGLDKLVDTATDIVGDVVEVSTLGLVKSYTAKKLSEAGLTVAEIAVEMDITVEIAKRLLK